MFNEQAFASVYHFQHPSGLDGEGLEPSRSLINLTIRLSFLFMSSKLAED